MKACRLHSFIKATLALVSAGFLANSASYAGPVTPDFDTFGLLSAATFGGSGIPNDRVAITTFGGVTLGLTATQRYSNPTVTDNGAGTYFATAGEDTLPNYALWNFDMYVSNASTTNYAMQLLWDLNPGAGTNEASLSSFGILPLAAGSTWQESWNLGMPFLGGGFDPTVAGEYSFALILRSATGQELGRSAINVNVGHVPDTASTGLLAVAGFGSLLVFARLRRRTK
jgi:hypothetical protein